jgi:hypothetical protein
MNKYALKCATLTFFLCLSAMSVSSTAVASPPTDMDSLLLQLDFAIRERPRYFQQKERKLEELKLKLRGNLTDAERFEWLDKLLNEYRPYNTDSALHVARERYQTSLRMKSQVNIHLALMNIAEVMITAGMYKEGIDQMHDIHSASLPESLHAYYYHIYRTAYGLMADYAASSKEKDAYTQLTNRYRDSLLLVSAPNSLTHVVVQSDQYNVSGQYEKAIRLLTDYYRSRQEDLHNTAIGSYTLSESYRLKGDEEAEKRYLIISATADMKSAVCEYVSLRVLATLLYQEGDIDRAYSYLKVCMDDALFCNARLRILEIFRIFPMVNDAYEQKMADQHRKLMIALLAISLLSLLLIVAIFYVYKHTKRMRLLNKKLNASNAQIKEANHSIAESSRLKEEYIGRYMDQCSVYIEKMDNYRRSLGRIASSGKVDELYRQIKATHFIEEELKEFYSNFDNTFLQLFPSFVEEFNDLLAEHERIHPKPGEQLNTELRIFALIRLGITDSVKIAQFLRYSVTTIYNYRTKVRNKAAGDRDQLEQKVMEICRMRPEK